jgi:hypothetical protein
MNLVRGFGRRNERARAALAVLVSLSSASAGLLGGCRKSAPPAPQTQAAATPARPEEVVAELLLPKPQELWPRLRALAGPLGAAMPSAPELAVAAVVGVPALAAGSFDLRSPVVGAWVLGDAAGMVVGVHVESGPELIAKVASGSNPTHRVERRGAISYLSRASGGGFAFAVCSDTVLIGPERAVERVGEYLARAAFPKARSEGPLVIDSSGSMKAWLVPALRNAWSARRAELGAALGRERALHGRPADFADPEAVLTALDALVQGGVAFVESTRDAHAELELPDGQMMFSLRVTPEANGAAARIVASMRPGSTALMRELPRQTAVALLHRRPADSTPAGPFARALFGARLSDADAAALSGSLEDLAAGRGNVEAVALTSDLGLVWQGDVHDANRLRAGMKSLLPLLTRPPFAAALGASVGRPSIERRASRSAGGRSEERSVIRLSTPGPAKAKTFDLMTQIDERRFTVSLSRAGSEPERAATGLDPAPAALLDAVGDVAWFALADLGKLGLAEPGAAALVSADVSARDGALVVSLRATDAGLRALAARGLGR